MTYLVDNDRVADWLGGRSQALQFLASLAGQGLQISLITYGEIYEGIYCSRDPKASERIFTRFLHTVPVVRLSRPIMRLFARVRGDLRSKGQLIPDADLLIAVTALHNNLSLVTRNVRDFQRVPGLVLYSSK